MSKFSFNLTSFIHTLVLSLNFRAVPQCTVKNATFTFKYKTKLLKKFNRIVNINYAHVLNAITVKKFKLKIILFLLFVYNKH